MTIKFLKMHLAGNGIVLVDLKDLPCPKDKKLEDCIIDFDSEKQSIASIYICNKRYGIGANAVAFLFPDNQVKVYDARGNTLSQADDVLLCLTRYAYDAGKIKNKTAEFLLGHETKQISILGSHEFRLSIGSPFSMLTNEVLTQSSKGITELIEYNEVSTSFSAIHLREDCLIANTNTNSFLDWNDFRSLSKKAFPTKTIIPVFSQILTRESLFVYSLPRRASSSTSAAAAAACASIFSGDCNSEVLVFFKTSPKESIVSNAIARDKDNSRRIAVEWDSNTNDFAVIGTGGYVFEGQFDIPFNE